MLFGIEQIVAAVISAYMEREKQKENQEQALKTIRAINDIISTNTAIIKEAILESRLEDLTGMYLGRVTYFKEYSGADNHKVILETISSDTNEILGKLQPIYSGENHVPTVRKIVYLEILVLSLRALVLSELKNRHGDNRDLVLLEQLENERNHCNWLLEHQLKRVEEARNEYRNYPDPVDTACIPLPQEDGTEGVPTSCNKHLWDILIAEKDLYVKDRHQGRKIDEAINTIHTSIVNVIRELHNKNDTCITKIWKKE